MSSKFFKKIPKIFIDSAWKIKVSRGIMVVIKKRKVRRFDMRVGMGYDVHRLVEGRKLILGGVEILYEKDFLVILTQMCCFMQ